MVLIYKFWSSLFESIIDLRQCTVQVNWARLFFRVRYSGHSPMYYKCRLHSNGHSKSSYDVTDYRRKREDEVEKLLVREGGGRIFSSCPLVRYKKLSKVNLTLASTVFVYIYTRICKQSIFLNYGILVYIPIPLKISEVSGGWVGLVSRKEPVLCNFDDH